MQMVEKIYEKSCLVQAENILLHDFQKIEFVGKYAPKINLFELNCLLFAARN
jgi:hypothetical protein